MSEWQKWNKTEPARIACYVHAIENARMFGVPPATETTDFDQRTTHPLELVRRVYEHLRSRRIPYDTAEIDFTDYHEVEQVIRQPDEVRAGGGNCLELALTFASLCQKLRLYPMVVLLEKHALVAVRLDENVEEVVETGRPPLGDYPFLSQGLLAPAADRIAATDKLIEWAADHRWVFVECTGYASSRELNGDTGTLPFEEALQRGVAQLRTQRLKQLVDVTYLQRHRVHRPYVPRLQANIPNHSVTLGRLGVAALRRWLVEPPERCDLDALTALRASIEDANIDANLVKLRSALEATVFVRTWMPEALTTPRLRAALTIVGLEVARDVPYDDMDYLTHVALHHPVKDENCGRALVSFVIAVALDAGLDCRAAAFDRWAHSLVDPVTVNDLRDEVRQCRESEKRRLLVSLHGSPTGNWPESVAAWLLDGDEVRAATVEPCEPNQVSAELAIGRLLDWAADLLGDAAKRLRRIDVAVPTALLPRWRPEDTKAGRRLGLDHDVIVRWSERLNPPAHIGFALRVATTRWAEIEKHGGVNWLEGRDTTDLSELLEHLENGVYPGGMGLRFTPNDREQLLELLLSFSPVLLWPDQETSSWDDIEYELRAQWTSLPYALAAAYRRSWPPRRETSPLSGVRAVWDDHDWLSFCRRAKSRARIAPSGGAA